ncbi:MAG: flagellar hook-basal body complex protein FliE [Pseudomonadota bacterium]
MSVTPVNRQAITKLYQQHKALFNNARQANKSSTPTASATDVRDRVDFLKSVNNNITNPLGIVDLLKIAERATIDHTHGKIDLVELATRIDEAITIVNRVVKIRDSLVGAFTEIMKTQL